MERREKHLFLYKGQLWRLISQFAMTEPYLFWKIVSKHLVLKWKLPLSGASLRLCVQVLPVYIYTSFSVWCCACERRCVLFVVTRTCVFCRTRALSVSRSCPPCQISGIYKSRQWKTDHRASSCHTSILPRASTDSLQHVLLIPVLLPTKFSAALHWFVLALCGRASVGGVGVLTSAELRVSTEVQLCSLWIPAFPRATLNDTVPRVQCLHILRCAVCHLELVSPVFVCIFPRASLRVAVAESAVLCRVLGEK